MFTKSVWSGSYFRSTGVSTARVPGSYIRNSVVGPCLLIVANTQSGSRYRVLGTGQDEGHVSLTDSESVEFEPEQGAEDMQDEVLQFIWLDYYFAREINDVPPPRDGPGQGAFDNRSEFVLGDPGARFGGENKRGYEVSGDKCMPHWSLFASTCFFTSNMSDG